MNSVYYMIYLDMSNMDKIGHHRDHYWILPSTLYKWKFRAAHTVAARGPSLWPGQAARDLHRWRKSQDRLEFCYLAPIGQFWHTIFCKSLTYLLCNSSSWLRLDTQSFFASKVPKERIEKVNDVMSLEHPLNVTGSKVSMSTLDH